MKKNDWVFNLIAVALVGYGAYMVNELPEGYTVTDASKFITAIVGGLGYLVYTNGSTIKNWFVNRKPSDRVFSPADYEEQDFKCLIHLRNRVTEAGSVEGVQTCAKLNEIIFSLHAAEKMKVIENATKTK